MEFVKIYYDDEEKIVDVNDVPHYVNMGWSLEKSMKKPESKVEKVDSKKDSKKQN